MDNRPIGVFDSGIGGLTVAKAIMNHLPHESLVYFGDTARVPYGSKSKNTVIHFSEQIIRFLLTQEVKAIVIACGTASANALDAVKDRFSIPIIGVTNPGAVSAVRATKNNHIGVIATEATIQSDVYHGLITQLDARITVTQLACPLFVPLVEEGWIDDPVTYMVAERYLSQLKKESVDTLVLGCTHYPLLIHVIQAIMGETVHLVNMADETAIALGQVLNQATMATPTKSPSHRFYVSDRAEKFEGFAKRILKAPMLPVAQVDIEAY